MLVGGTGFEPVTPAVWSHKSWRMSKKSHAYSNQSIASWAHMPKWPMNRSLGLIDAKSSKSFFVWQWFRNEQAAISISTWCIPTKHQSAHKFEAAAKRSKPKFGPWTRRTCGGCYKYLIRTTEITKPPTSKQSRIKTLSVNKQRATYAVQIEREQQKRSEAKRSRHCRGRTHNAHRTIYA